MWKGDKAVVGLLVQPDLVPALSIGNDLEPICTVVGESHVETAIGIGWQLSSDNGGKPVEIDFEGIHFTVVATGNFPVDRAKSRGEFTEVLRRSL
jgi:hypothetical protein